MYVHLQHQEDRIMKKTFTKYINVNGRLMDLSYPQVMGILNLTPDSFYADSRKQSEAEIIARARQICEEGGSIIDVGAYSSRPNAEHIAAGEGRDCRLSCASNRMRSFRSTRSVPM